MVTDDETILEDCCQAFAKNYEVSSLPAMRQVERSVLGCDYGGTSWTTTGQAQQILDKLSLGPGMHLLDVGAGSGWPGLFLADAAGCDVTLVDLPLNALGIARDRAQADGIDQRVAVVSGSGAALPFLSNSFGAISHSDVLCCLPEKREMLVECRRVVAVGGAMLFSVIAVPQGLSRREHGRAVEAGPPFVDAPADYAELLSQSAWRVIERIDVTDGHRKSLSALVQALEENAALQAALGSDAVNDARARRREQIVAIDAGLLCREIFVAAAS